MTSASPVCQAKYAWLKGTCCDCGRTLMAEDAREHLWICQDDKLRCTQCLGEPQYIRKEVETP